jgi:hypothetical protein
MVPSIRKGNAEGNISAYVVGLLLCIIAVSFSLSAYAYDRDTVEVTVVTKDNLINICKKLLEEPRKWSKIAKLNRLRNPHLIFPGQKLIIPVDMLRGVPLDGVVTFVQGEVRAQAKEGEEWKTLHGNERVTQGSSIRTGDESGAEVSFEDGDSFLMRSNTILTIRVAQKSALNLLQRLYLSAGRTITRVKEATGRKSRFEIQTPSAVAVARGTSFRVGVDEKETMRSEVLKGLVDVEAMAKSVEVREGEGTLARKNEPPMEPRKLLLPPSLLHREQIYKAMPLTFQFTEIGGASSYRIMVTRDSAGKDILRERVIKPAERAEIAGVDDGEYFLISQSIDADGLEGVPADPVAFRVRTNPLPPFIQSPVDGATPRERKVEFKWLKVKDAVAYHLQIAEDREFARILLDKNDLTATEFISPPLEFKPYFFRVSSLADDGYEGAPSDIQGFTIVPPPPAPVVEKPEMKENEIRLRWKNLGEGITYRFQMSMDSDFRNILMDRKVEMPEITFPRPEEPGIYYVRTSGIDREGYEGDSSLPQSFEVRKRFPLGILGILGAVGLLLLAVF